MPCIYNGTVYNHEYLYSFADNEFFLNIKKIPGLGYFYAGITHKLVFRI